jgi:hypothetical protein
MKVQLLEQRHPDRPSDVVLERYRALAEGGERWRDLVSFWLPQNGNEPADIYNDRKKRAVYHNYAGGIVGLLVAYLFSEAPSIEGLEGDWAAAWLDNVDRRRTPLATWWRQRFFDALVDGVAWCWVNLPARAPELVLVSRADEEKAGLLDAYLVPLCLHEVLDWGEDSVGALSWVLIRQVEQVRVTVDQPRVAVYRWFYIDGVSIRRWEWKQTAPEKPAPTPEDEAEELGTLQHNMGGLPVVRLQIPRGLHAMRLLHDPALAHLRARNDLTWALGRTAHAMPWIKRKWGGDAPQVGSGYYLELEHEDDFGWTEPQGNSFAVLRDDAKDLKEEIYRVVHQMALAADNDSSRMRASGESKQSDWQASDVVMSGYADLVRQAMREVVRIVSRVRTGTEQAVTVKGLDGWQTMDLMTFLTSSGLALEAKQLSPTFRRVIARRQAERLLGDEVTAAELEAIRAEIDGAPEEDRIGGSVDSGVEKQAAWKVILDYKAKLVDRAAAKQALIGLFNIEDATAEKWLGDANFEPPKPPAPKLPGAGGPPGGPPKPGAKGPPA